jgi:hypothetical protein
MALVRLRVDILVIGCSGRLCLPSLAQNQRSRLRRISLNALAADARSYRSTNSGWRNQRRTRWRNRCVFQEFSAGPNVSVTISNENALPDIALCPQPTVCLRCRIVRKKALAGQERGIPNPHSFYRYATRLGTTTAAVSGQLIV